VNYIRNTWLGEIINIIKLELKFVDKKSAVLEGDCVDRFFQLVRILMQDTLGSLIKKNCNYLYSYLKSFIPDDVIIKSTDAV